MKVAIAASIALSLLLGIVRGVEAEKPAGPDDPVPPNALRSVKTILENSKTIMGSSISTISDPGPRTMNSGERSIAASDRSILADESAVEEGTKKVEDGSEQIKTAGLTVSENEEEIRIDIASDVLFDFNRWGIRKSASAALDQVSEILRQHEDLEIVLTGHTDSIGTYAYNEDLSLKRAKSVRAWLIHKGKLYAAKMKTEGQGELSPVAPNTKPDGSDDPEGRQNNRRVEIRVKK